MSDTFFVETTPPSSTSEHWAADGPPVPARPGKDRQGVKLRSACDFCHAAKVKCSGGSVCDRCRTQDLPCAYSVALRAGKPKGSCNRKTLDKHARIRQQHAAKRSNFEWGWSPSPTMDTGVNEATWFNVMLLGMGLQMEDQNTPGFDHLGCASDLPQSLCLLPPDSMPEHARGSIPVLTEGISFETHQHSLSDTNFDMSGTDNLSNFCSNAAPVSFSPLATPETPVTNLPDSELVCTCFSDQTNSLNGLYSFHQMVQSQSKGNRSSSPGNYCRLDVCIQRINTALNSSCAFLSCRHCSKESCSVLLAVSTIQLVMRLYEYVVAEIQCAGNTSSSRDKPLSTLDCLSGEQPHMSCRLGDYEVSPEESAAIRRLVVRRALQKGRETLTALKRLSVTEGSSTSGLPSPGKSSDTHEGAKPAGAMSQVDILPQKDLTAADAAYLQQIVCRSDAVLDVFLRTVCPV